MSLISSGVLTIGNIFFKIPGIRRVSWKRRLGPHEGIDDQETADSYETTNRKLPFRMIRQLAVYKLKKLKPAGLLADLGCGPGYLTGDIARALPELDIIALDISEEMLDRARKHLSDKRFTNRFEFRQGDIQELPFTDNSLDFVVSTLSLHHWMKPPKSFLEIYRVLKPGGKFMVFDTRRDSPRVVFFGLSILQRWFLPAQLKEKNEPTSSVLASYTPKEATRLIEGIPFTGTSVSGGLFWLVLSGMKGES